MNLSIDRAKRKWFKVYVALYIVWCCVRCSNGLNNEAIIENLGLDDNTVKIKHKGNVAMPNYCHDQLPFSFTYYSFTVCITSLEL